MKKEIKEKLEELVRLAQCADIGFIDSMGTPSIRRVFCSCHRGIKAHLISTNTSSLHVQELAKDNRACLYFEDSRNYVGLSLFGKVIIHHDAEYKELLWHEGDEQYYPKGVTDEDYCVLEFIAERGRYYMGMENPYKGDVTPEELAFREDETSYIKYQE